ncbi:MAG TPA: hypothetical protein VF789_19290 [Thermoanaerobaculia bacterium]
MKDFITKATFGFLMAQLFPGSVAVFAIAFTSLTLESQQPNDLTAIVAILLENWKDASTLLQVFILALCIGAGMFIHGVHWATLGYLENKWGSVFQTYWHDKRLWLQVLLGPIKIVRESLDLLFTARHIRSASVRENIYDIHKDFIPHFEFIEELYLYYAQFFVHTAYALVGVIACAITFVIHYGVTFGRLGLILLAYVTCGTFLVLGRILLRSLFHAENQLAERSSADFAGVASAEVEEVPVAKEAEKYGKALLKIFEENAGRGRRDIFVANLRQVFFDLPGRRNYDFDAGIAWLKEKKIVEDSSKRHHFRLLKVAESAGEPPAGADE